MKVVPIFVLFAFLLHTSVSKPLEAAEEGNSNIYIIGNIRNAAMSHGFSKSQAVSDANNSEWNNKSVMNKHSHRTKPKTQTAPVKPLAALRMPEGRDAANIALATGRSKAQAVENNQKSGFNTQKLGITSGVKEDYEDGQ